MPNDHSDARQAVLDSAIEAFARKGYAGTSIQDVLEATGLSKPTLYYHFGSKAGLFRAILNFAYDESYRMMHEASSAGGSCEKRLVAVADALFTFALNRHNLTRLVFASAFAAPEELPPDSISLIKRQRVLGLMHDIVETGQQAGELGGDFSADELSNGIFGQISHRIRHSLMTGSGGLDHATAARMVRLFMQGAGPGTKSS